MTVDPEELREYEAEMGTQMRDAGTRLRVAAAWHQAADKALDGLTRPVWGGPVDDWHRARDAVEDSLQACEAYEAFGR
jgi:hypothetical protein